MKNYVELVGSCPPRPSASVDNIPSIYIILHTIKNVGVNVAMVLTFSCIYLSHFTSLYLIKTGNRNSFFMDQFKPNYQEISNYRENEYLYWKVSDRFFTRKDTHAAGFLKVHRITVSRGDWWGNPANIKVECNGAVGYVGGSLTVRYPLFSVHKLWLNKSMQCFYRSISSKR